MIETRRPKNIVIYPNNFKFCAVKKNDKTRFHSKVHQLQHYYCVGISFQISQTEPFAFNLILKAVISSKDQLAMEPSYIILLDRLQLSYPVSQLPTNLLARQAGTFVKNVHPRDWSQILHLRSQIHRCYWSQDIRYLVPSYLASELPLCLLQKTLSGFGLLTYFVFQISLLWKSRSLMRFKAVTKPFQTNISRL